MVVAVVLVVVMVPGSRSSSTSRSSRSGTKKLRFFIVCIVSLFVEFAQVLTELACSLFSGMLHPRRSAWHPKIQDASAFGLLFHLF